jgi:prepilin-type N-terminal cleavage/methylation domain-containing protein/prepilin-type processing-associated H-X9-DG protein
MKATNQNIAGFTLTELLVVIAVIAMLAVTLLPALAATKLKELSTQCTGNLRQLAMAASVCQTENKNIPWRAVDQLWFTPLKSAQNSGALPLLCPLASTPAATTGNSQGTANKAWVWNVVNPVNPALPDVVTNGSYGLNGWLYGYNDTLGGYLEPGYQTNFFSSAAAVAHPRQTPVFVDALWPDLWPYSGGFSDYNVTWYIYNEFGQAGNNVPPYIGMARCCIERHGSKPPLTSFVAVSHTVKPFPGGINVAFVDGHVNYTRLDDLWLLYWNRNSVPQPRR